METFSTFVHQHIFLIVCLVLWEGIWKVIALWKSARNNELTWFICIVIFNTVGLLPILYLVFKSNRGNIMTTKSTLAN